MSCVHMSCHTWFLPQPQRRMWTQILSGGSLHQFWSTCSTWSVILPYGCSDPQLSHVLSVVHELCYCSWIVHKYTYLVSFSRMTNFVVFDRYFVVDCMYVYTYTLAMDIPPTECITYHCCPLVHCFCLLKLLKEHHKLTSFPKKNGIIIIM